MLRKLVFMGREIGGYLRFQSAMEKVHDVKKLIVVMAALLGAVGVGIGAFAAHGLEKSLIEQELSLEEVADRLRQCDVAVRYHMLHTLVLLAIGVGGLAVSWRLLISAGFLLLGIALFSGGLYSMVFAGEMGHWAIVPLGGLSFIIGWLTLATAAFAGGKEVEA